MPKPSKQADNDAPQAGCLIDGCDRKPRARGWCKRHYARWLEHGSPIAGRSYRNGERACSVEGCERKHNARGYCKRHYGLLVEYKHVDRSEPRVPKFPPPADQIAWMQGLIGTAGVDCIAWPFQSDGRYGKITYKGTKHGAHRLMCTLAHGEPSSPDLHAAHQCGHSTCCNPNHIRWATPVENAFDKVRHGTARRSKPADIHEYA